MAAIIGRIGVVSVEQNEPTLAEAGFAVTSDQNGQTAVQPAATAVDMNAFANRDASDFVTKARVAVTRIASGRREDLGIGELLASAKAGQPLEVSLPAVGVMRTTAVRSVSRVGVNTLQLVTRRSTYRLDLK